ncbi:hypothetical protein RJZ56_005359 [Blastomyces dermatitidis]|nr:uncharacterized protein BDCG_01945 [Blastomyces dermatitidis ER-3]EGE79615.1 hypothetical protein BDDG_02556 [Blastomyces dermatitidis ATCC 18188]EQL34243.1 hypothetical protein BDFG_03910 [Blastomyces dermatitidis ATCC 26199]EEQ86825.1 hypothetical protein BDCG_01945 [Blastomyces dermatitidis ER-3]EQL34244.1 hypothetical protein, variant [Blastomyces dermatitidis ATCC 26199]KMW67068.1 hypothetical protein, variant [Blastomyces dermatitidis ATCC 18188]
MSMMAPVRLEELDNVFDEHPSLTASLEDFEDSSRPSPLLDLPSQHSGFQSEDTNDRDPDTDIDSSIDDPWSPPVYQQRRYLLQQQHFPPTPGSAWYRHQPYLRDKPDLKPTYDCSPLRSREVSPQYEDALEKPLVTGEDDPADLTIPANIPLPVGAESPQKGRSPSPAPSIKLEGKAQGKNESNPNNTSDQFDLSPQELTSDSFTNYIRFAVRAEVQHREPFDAFFNYVSQKIDSVTKSRTNTVLSFLIGIISFVIIRALFLPPIPLPVPDLVKLSGLARSFEPLIYYSENGVQQIGALQETGVAVWDLGESVRGTNMTSAPVIVRQLDELSESLKTLSLELTRFFANVDADIDSILIVMDWAKRELEALSSQPAHSLPSIFFDNFHSLLSRLGALETAVTTSPDGSKSPLPSPTRLGSLITTIFGTTRSQRTHRTLTHTFTEFLAVLEESINSELTHSSALFALFESIDRQFLNLQRTVVRESDAQERAEGEMLSSLWTRVLGPNAAALRKYEKNRQLLSSVRQRTVANKHLLMDHRGKLLTLKVNLETLRRKLVSPLVRRNDSVGFGLLGASGGSGSGGDREYMGRGVGSSAQGSVELVVEGQIKGLEGAYEYLKGVRERQKAKLMEMVYGAGSRRSGTGAGTGLLDGLSGDGAGLSGTAGAVAGGGET